MKKNIMLVLLAAIMVLTLAACGGENKSSAAESVASSALEESVVEESQEEESASEQDTSDLLYTFKDPGQAIVFDYPDTQSIEEGFSQIFKRGGQYFFAYCRQESAGEPLESIPEALAEEYADATDKYFAAEALGFDITAQENITVNGVPMLQIEGKVLLEDIFENQYTTPMFGYVFEKDGLIVELIAALTDEEMADAYYDEMVTFTQEMISTLRDER